MKWISLQTGHVPPSHKPVLTIDDLGIYRILIPLNYISGLEWFDKFIYYGNKNLAIVDELEAYTLSKITHWCELIQPEDIIK